MGRKTKKDGDSFEQRLARLEELVARLESGQLPLEQAVTVFEEGMQLAKSLGVTLDSAERRVEVLLAETDGAVTRQPFDAPLDVERAEENAAAEVDEEDEEPTV